MRYIIFFLIFSSLAAAAQEKPDLENVLPGVWKGSLYNDTTQKDILYELAISEKNGRFSGYSHIIFMIDSIANIGVKDVSVRERKGYIIVEDKKLIDNNYAAPPADGVHTTIQMQLSENDTVLILSGTWSTNPTREFNALTGTIWLSKKKEVLETRIIPKLATMNLARGLSFMTADMLHRLYGGSLANNNSIDQLPSRNEEKVEPMMTIVEPELVISMPLPKDSNRPKHIEYTGLNPDSLQQVNSNKSTKVEVLAKTKSKTDTSLSKEVVPEKTTIAINVKPNQKKEDGIKKEKDISIKKIENPLPVSKPVVTIDTTKNNASPEKFKTAINKETRQIIEKKDLSKRIVQTIRTVEIAADSLVFTLYDNGTVDGDTVSVLLNGKVILSRVGLSVQAVNKTIHLTPDMGDSINIVMYAENLGSLPPNTGLLIIREEDKNYEIRFSGDLKKNSAIILKRIKE